MENKGKNNWIKWFVTGIFVFWYMCTYGNPVSHFLTIRGVNRILKEQYPDFRITNVRTSVILGIGDGLATTVTKQGSSDEHFVIWTDELGRYKEDSYERDISGKLSTKRRIQDSYGNRVYPLVKTTLEDYKDLGIGWGLGEMPSEHIIADREYTGDKIKYYSLKYFTVSINSNSIREDEKEKEMAQRLKAAFEENNLGFYSLKLNDEQFYWETLD